MNPNKDIELVIQAAVIVLIEDLQPYKHIEEHRAHLSVGVWQELGAGEVQDECGDDLIDCLPDDHFPHRHADDGGFAGCGGAVQDFVGGRVGGEGERGEGVPGDRLEVCFSMGLLGSHE